ncbi:MAG: DNA integrity scanning protein DisA nucleotide-binding domain protein [Deltaproteobacteria bacterium]|nr:DNA integrity scanning protein DisA nucleotide-binding domain protein [Deltaproteobacteria bacterium]
MSLRRAPPFAHAAGLGEVLADAAFALAHQKRGALLVLPGRDALRPWTSGGIELDAAPSVALLSSLFDPHSPGHDGAVLVEGGRLSQFAVRLPLSTSDRLPEVLGTRHHAAQGLSEATDALVIAVSEERGAVSTFARGQMSTAATQPELLARIATHWTEAGYSETALEARQQMGRLLREAIVSVSAAILFWITVVLGGNRLVETGFAVPVEYTAPPGNMALVGDKPSEVKIHVSGPSADLDRVVPSQLPVTVDLSRTVPGHHRFPITEENLRLPRGVRLLSADPPSVEVIVNEMVERDLEVSPQIVGKLRRRLRLASTEVTPATIHVLAPAGQTLGPLRTAPVDLGPLTQTATLTREILAPPGVRPASDGWPDVKVTVHVEGRAVRRAAHAP